MFAFCGYNFCEDLNCLDFVPTNVQNITSTTLSNGILDHFNVSRDVTSPYSTTIPTMWDYLTIMDANFNGNINAGNVDFVLSQLSGIKVKYRILGTFDWTTIKYIPITKVEDLSFSIVDYLAKNNTEYEYAFVPVLNNIEGNYITNTILSQFNGVFICDSDTIYKFYAGVQYGTSSQNISNAVFEPFGRKYPIVVSNSLTDYQSGSVSGKVLGQNFETTREIVRKDIITQNKILLNFLTNKKAKILKDWNGNFILMIVVNKPSVIYDNNYGMGIVDTYFDYVEMGNPTNSKDLISTGMLQDYGG